MSEDLFNILLIDEFRVNQGLDEIHRFLGGLGELRGLIEDVLGDGHDRGHCELLDR
jgi:hypothetical protein